MEISTGNPESHPTPLPYTPGYSPANANLTPVSPGETSREGTQGGVCDTAGQQAERLSASEAAISAAQSSGMAAEGQRRDFYHQDIAPLGASYGIEMTLPEVPAFTLPAAHSYGYLGTGDEPVPAE